jgi:hypothetical protein
VVHSAHGDLARVDLPDQDPTFTSIAHSMSCELSQAFLVSINFSSGSSSSPSGI